MAELRFDIVEEIGIITEGRAWDTRIDLISWNGGEPKYNIRQMSKDLDRAGKGINLTKEELVKLFEICKEKGILDGEPKNSEKDFIVTIDRLIDYED